MKTVDIKGKPYIEVNERIKHFRENYKDWALESEIVSLENGVCVIKATVKNPEGIIKATGYAYEKENSTFINKTSYIENCETSAWGRALGNFGIGIDTSIASAEEVLNASLNQNADFVPDVINDDTDIYVGLSETIDSKSALKYFNEYKDKVNDKAAFTQAWKDHIKTFGKKEE